MRPGAGVVRGTWLTSLRGLETVANAEADRSRTTPRPPSIRMQGRSLVPILTGQVPTDWRASFYYRYYDDPGAHNTAAHYGVRTATHKLIYSWKQDQWELYDLRDDPQELRNVYEQPAQVTVREQLKRELARLKRELKDEDQFTKQLPPHGVDGGPALKPATRPAATE